PVELQRRHPELYELLAACYRQDPAKRPVPPEVEAAAQGAEEEYSRQAIRECTAALQQHPDYLEAYQDRAAHYLSLGEREAAMGQAEPALADCAEALRLGGEAEAQELRDEVLAAIRPRR